MAPRRGIYYIRFGTRLERWLRRRPAYYIIIIILSSLYYYHHYIVIIIILLSLLYYARFGARLERWLEEEAGLVKYFLNAELPRDDARSYKFIPFGCGLRMCVGYGLGRIVMVLKAAMHLHAFSFESEDGAKLDLETEHFGITLQPNQYNIKVVPRPAARLAKATTSNCIVK